MKYIEMFNALKRAQEEGCLLIGRYSVIVQLFRVESEPQVPKFTFFDDKKEIYISGIEINTLFVSHGSLNENQKGKHFALLINEDNYHSAIIKDNYFTIILKHGEIVVSISFQ